MIKKIKSFFKSDIVDMSGKADLTKIVKEQKTGRFVKPFDIEKQVMDDYRAKDAFGNYKNKYMKVIHGNKGSEINYMTDDDMEDPKLMPEGTYSAKIIDSFAKQSHLNAGKNLQLTFQITKGHHYGRKIIHYLPTSSEKRSMKDYCMVQVNSLARACGVRDFEFASDLHFMPLLIEIGIRKYQEYDFNFIKKWSKR